MSQENTTSLRTPWTTNTVDDPKLLQRKLTEQRFESDQLRLLGSAVRVAAQGIAILTPAVEALGPRIAFVNDGFCAMYGRQREDIIGQTPVAFGIVERQQAIFESLLQHVFDSKPFDAQVTARRQDGSELELELQLVPVEDGGQLTHWVAFLRDVTDSRNQIIALRHQAMHDGLTDLPNRMMLFDSLEKALETAHNDEALLALLLMDLDRFKEVNDTFGHHFGDVLLKQVALRLRNQLQPADTVARLGGDEFAIVLTSAADSSAVASAARRILNTLEQPFVVEGQVLEVGASIGIALYPLHGTDTRTLMRRADVAMYSAKQSNTGYTFHNQEQESRSPDQLSLVVEMRSAIERNEFELYYQPKRHLRSGLMTRAEVLVRWNHPTRGLLAPVSFVPIAERTGLIKAMTDWILDRAMEQCRLWQDAGAPIHLAVNVSAKSLQEQSLPAKVQAVLDKWRIDPRFLKIEITESSIMADPAHALAIMSLLQSMGVRLSIDDFGTGYSSLTHLRELPVDEIKIDRSFVAGMATSDADAAIVRTVIDLGVCAAERNLLVFGGTRTPRTLWKFDCRATSKAEFSCQFLARRLLAHNLGKQVCAEGVEDAETMRRLEDMGCDLAQGYFISRPVPAAALMQWLTDNFWGLKRTR